MSLIAATKRLAAGRPALACGATATVALGALALVNHAAARRAEREHPPRGEVPRGQFIEVDGVRLHHTGRGVGQGARAALRGACDGASGKGPRRCITKRPRV